MILKRSNLWLSSPVGNAKELLEAQNDVKERKIKEIGKKKGETRWAKQRRNVFSEQCEERQ